LLNHHYHLLLEQRLNESSYHHRHSPADLFLHRFQCCMSTSSPG
jgi:hypothetical protein